MSKHNLSIKKVKKLILSINDLMERSFKELKYFKSNYKKVLFNRDNRVILGVVTVAILTLFYFLIPTFYNKNIIQLQIKNQIFKNYKIDIKFNDKINYGLLPKPHFSAKNLSILRNGKEIAITKNLKIFIGIGQFFSINKIDIKDLVFNKSDFNIRLDDFVFFENFLKIEPNENKIFFKKSNIFFKNEDDEVLFINQINNSKFHYDSNNLLNILSAKNEVFNVPFKLTVKNDKFNKEIYIKFNSKKIRLNLISKINYEKEPLKGLLDILFVNKNTSLNYQIKKNSLSFFSDYSQNFYKGTVDFKPFYLSIDFNYEGLNLKNLFNNKSIFIDLINSKILNNKNLNALLNFKIKDVTNINELNNLDLKVSIEQGDIIFSNSIIMWKDDLEIILDESLLVVNDDGINLTGTVMLNFIDLDNFYKSFQVPKRSRKNIKQVKVDFIYNFNTKSVRLDSPKINDTQNINLEKFLNTFNTKEDRTFNKITFKNFINGFFHAYAG